MAEPIATVGKLAGMCGHDGTDWEKVSVDTDGELQVDIKSSGLPTGAATSAKQDTMITALQKIDDLQGAVGSNPAGDDLRVNVINSALAGQLYGWDGSDWVAISAVGTPGPSLKVVIGEGGNIAQTGNVGGDAIATNTKVVFVGGMLYAFNGATWDRLRCTDYALDVNIKYSFESIVEEHVVNANLAAGASSLCGTQVASGKVWNVTAITFVYVGTAPTSVAVYIEGLADNMTMIYQISPASGQIYLWSGNVYMQVGDRVCAYVTGATAGDDLHLRYAGVQMTAP